MDIILYNIDPIHFRERWNYSGAPGRSSTIAFTPIGSAGIQANMKKLYTIDDLIKIFGYYNYYSHRERWFTKKNIVHTMVILEISRHIKYNKHTRQYSGAAKFLSCNFRQKPQGTCECCNRWKLRKINMA